MSERTSPGPESPVAAASPRERRLLGLIVLAAALLRLALLALPRVIRWDEPAYLLLGRSLWLDHRYTIWGLPELHYSPLYPLLSGLVLALTGDGEAASGFWFVLLGAAAVLPVYAIARALFGGRAALAAAALVAILPALSTSCLYWGTMTEPLFVALLYAAIWCAMSGAESRSSARFGVGGALIGLSYLARPEAVGWAVTLPAAALVVWACRGELARRRNAAALAAFFATFLLVGAPYVVYLHGISGRWMVSGKLGITYESGRVIRTQDVAAYDELTNGVDPATGEMRWDSESRFSVDMLGLLFHHTGELVARVGINLRQLLANPWRQPVLPLPLLLPIAVAVFRRGGLRRRLEREVWLLAAAAPVAAFLLFHVQQRFFVPALPALLIWAAAGLVAIAEAIAARLPPAARLRPLASPGALAAALVLLTAAGLALVHVAIVREQVPTCWFAHKAAGRWIHDHTPADARVLTVDYAICVYGDRTCLASPRVGYHELLDYARRHGVGYLVVDDVQVRAARPFLAFLLDGDRPAPELEPVFRTADQTGTTVVFRLRG